MTNNFYEVLVGNIGKVWEGNHYGDGMNIYTTYIDHSKNNYGRAAGEDVTFWVDGEIIEEFTGSITMSLPE